MRATRPFATPPSLLSLRGATASAGWEPRDTVADKGIAANVDDHQGMGIFTLVDGGLMAEASMGGQAVGLRPR